MQDAIEAPQIELCNVSKRYGPELVVDDLSFAVHRGELFCLLGPSGSGKTTVLGLIAGFLLPASGTIKFRGTPVTSVPVHKRSIGMVFQDLALFPHLSVYENIAFGLRRRRVAARAELELVGEALELVQLHGLERRKPAELSGGQRQRVALARALVIRPTVLLLDEPLSSLDAKLREEMRSELRRIQEATGVTMIMVTHDQEEALSMAHRIAILSYGVLQQIGEPHELYSAPASAFVASFVGQANLVQATVLREGPNTLAVDSDLGPMELGRRDSSPALGETITLLLRPERLQIARPAADLVQPGAVQGEVRGISFLGATWRVEVAVAQKILIATVATSTGTPPFQRGDQVLVACDPADVVVVLNGARDEIS